MKKPESGKTALITGASSGIGLELARLFAAEGTGLLLCARNGAALESLAEELRQKYGTKVYCRAMDLSEPDAAEELWKWCSEQSLAVDYLINNAGFGDFGFFAESDIIKQRQMIDLNITTLTLLTRYFLPSMISRRYGRVMNVSSTAAFQPGPTMSVYYATKSYVLHFSEAIANELKGSGVTVTALCPGPTESGFQAVASMQESRLVKGRKLPSSAEVAAYGYKAMMKGKTVAVHGFMNRVMAAGVGFFPRALVVKVTRFLQNTV